MKTIKSYLSILVIIASFVLVVSCDNEKNQSTIIFKKYLSKAVDTKIGDSVEYLIITSKGCMGCIQKGIEYVKRHPKYASHFKRVIYSKNILSIFPTVSKIEGHLFLDSMNTIEHLNLHLTGFTILEVAGGEIVRTRGLNVLNSSSEELMNDFFYDSSRVMPHKIAKEQPEHKGFMKEMYYPDFNKYIDSILIEGLCKTNKTVLVFYTSDYCNPCKKMEPVLDSISKLNKKRIDFVTVNFSRKRNMLISKRYGIKATPTVWIMQDNRKVREYIGFLSAKDIENILSE
jgi:thioredoxin 1